MIVKAVVNFYGEDIPVIEAEREIGGKMEPVLAIVAKPFFEGILGVDWKSQRAKIMEDMEWYEPFTFKSEGADGKMYDMVCLPYKKVNHLINSINVNRIPEGKTIVSIIDGKEVEEPARVKLRRYQEECAIVLHDYWNRGFSLNFRAEPSRFDSAMSYHMLESSRIRYNSLFQSLAASIVDKRGAKGADFDKEVLAFTDVLSEEVTNTIKAILGADFLDTEAGRIRRFGEPETRPISGTEALDISALQSCFGDLVSLYRRGELGDDYSAILDELPHYFEDYLDNTQNRYVQMRSTFRRGKGLL